MWAIMFTVHHGLISATNGLITKQRNSYFYMQTRIFLHHIIIAIFKDEMFT